MTDLDTSPEDRSIRRRAARALARAASVGSTLLIAGGLLGQAVRDRNVATALLMYIPLPLVGVAAMALDVPWKGRSIPRFRYGPTALGLAATAWSAHAMIGTGTVDLPHSGDRELSVLHWNVQWGGGLFRGPRTWSDQRAAMVGRAPDLIVLSESPPGDWIDRLVADLGPGASSVGIHHDPSSPYWYRLVVCSRWPVRLERRVALPGGMGMSVIAEVEGRPIRLLVVDGISSPTRSRRPFLRAIAAACREADATGEPLDLIVGDFNTPARSIGFDELQSLGYRLAGRSARGWRATFPAWLPVYDIDHAWLAPRLRLGSCTFFNGPHTDHRGQVIRILIPEPRE